MKEAPDGRFTVLYVNPADRNDIWDGCGRQGLYISTGVGAAMVAAGISLLSSIFVWDVEYRALYVCFGVFVLKTYDIIRYSRSNVIKLRRTVMDYMISDLGMNEIDGHRFIEWRTRSDFEYHAEVGSAVQIISKSSISYKGVIFDFDESGLYLRTSVYLGSPQVHIMYEDIINIEVNSTKSLT